MQTISNIEHCFSYPNLHLTCKYLSCSAAGDSEIISDASLNAPDAFFSPSAAITYQKDQILCGFLVEVYPIYYSLPWLLLLWPLLPLQPWLSVTVQEVGHLYCKIGKSKILKIHK